MRGRSIFIVGITTIIAATGFLVVDGIAGPRSKKRPIEHRGEVGPDVVAWSIAGQGGFDVNYYGSSGGVGGYAIATVSCNFGDQGANWYGGTDQSPLISQNLFRLKDGRFEQIGISWLKHSFCALDDPGCGSCQAQDCNILGIGCQDTYWAGLNAGGEGPRSDVNAYTGEYNYPFTVNSSGPGSIRANLQIANIDVDPGSNPGARYFVEGQYICNDDASWGNQMNNASWREIGFNSISSPYGLGNDPGETIVGEPGILAWADADSSVQITEVITPNDGMVLVGVSVTDNSDGTYHYEYAIQNLNCHRSVGSVTIPSGGSAINVGFHDINYHSGEIYDGTDWDVATTANSVTWSTVTYNQNQNGNALRWGSLYNFRFDSPAAPEVGEISMDFFRPGTTLGFDANTMIPAGSIVDPCTLPLDSCSEDVNGDGIVSVGDVLEVIGNWGDCGDGTYRPYGDVNGDCCVTVSDLLQQIAAWGQDCAPMGACCLSSGGCQGDVTSAQCDALGGNYQGDTSSCSTSNCPELAACCFSDGACDMMFASNCSANDGASQGAGSNCKSVSCPVAGAGDECSGPLFASVGENLFETYTATPSGNAPDDSDCYETYLDWGNTADIWFLWVADGSGSVHFSTCDGSSFDTSMVLYEGTCDNQVACNGDGVGDSGCQEYYSAIDYNVDDGETYYIRIGGWKGETGEGTLTID